MGTIELCKLADLGILDADPTADIRNAWKINRVIKGGWAFEHASLGRISGRVGRWIVELDSAAEISLQETERRRDHLEERHTGALGIPLNSGDGCRRESA